MQHPSAHQILLFVLQAGILLALARSLGELARRLGQPEVLGELLAGVVAGPLVLGVLLPGVQRGLFPPGVAQRGPIGAVAEVGGVLLLLIAGFETDLGAVARRGRPALPTALCGIALPFACALGLASALPSSLVGPPGGQPVFDLFVATALSVSALPAASRTLVDLGLVPRDLGRLLLAAGTFDDTAGWILLVFAAGAAASRLPAATAVLLPAAGTLAVLALAFRFGPRACGAALRWVGEVTGGQRAAVFAAVAAFALGGAALTQAVGLQPFVGAFAAGAALRHVSRIDRVRAQIEAITLGVFAPLFFAVAGLSVDPARLLAPGPLAALAALAAVAFAGKGLGAYLGARLGALPHGLALNLGVGLNARGAPQFVVAAVGLSLGVLDPTAFTALVALAVVGSAATPPLLRRTVALLPPDPGEGRRPDGGAAPVAGGLGGMRRILVPARGGENARVGAVIASCLARRRGAEVTVLHVARLSSAPIGPGGRAGRIGNSPAGLPTPPPGTSAATREGRRPAGRVTRPETGLASAQVARPDALAAPPRQAGSAVVRPGSGAATTAPDAAVATGSDGQGDPGRHIPDDSARPPAGWRMRTACGPPAATILQEALRGYDLLVLGATEIGRTRQALFGSVVDAVLRLSPCVTLVVRAGRRGGGTPRRILLPTRGDAAATRAAALAVEVAADCGAAVTALNVVEARRPGPDAQRQIRSGYAAVEAVVAMGAAAQVPVEGRVALARFAGAEILRVAAAGGFDLIVMGANLSQAGRRVRYGRTVARVLHHPGCDLALLDTARVEAL